MFSKLESLPRNYKRALMLGADAVTLPFAYWLAFNLRLDFQHLFLSPLELCTIALTVIVTMILFIRAGLYRAVIRYLGIQAGWTLLRGAIASALALTFFGFLLGVWHPRSVPLIYFVLVLIFVAGSRFIVRQILHSSNGSNRRNVAIYGAGAAGVQAMMSLFNSPEYKPILFVDDDKSVQGRVFNAIPVMSVTKFKRQFENLGISDVLLAMPSVPRSRRREIIEGLSPLPVHVHTIPGMSDLVSGRARIEEIRDIDIEDLLGRDAVVPNQNLMHANIRGKVVMVTGAGGSIGSELCRQIACLDPKVLVLFEQSEFSLYKLENEIANLVDEDKKIHVIAVLGSILDQELLESTIVTFDVDTIYHAAAYKHVPIVEHNFIAGIRNNVFGTLNVAEVANRNSVETCILISTDKAVRPTNIMGASKRLAELVFQALSQVQEGTCFTMVRFGNVLGSSGSVIPRFREQIAKGGPLTVTHPDIIRYFMTIPEAAQLVIQSGAMARGGEVFVLDMGEPVKIANLARKMVALMGLVVKDADGNGDIEISYTGLRPGEKLYEELLIGDRVTQTSHPRVMQAQEFTMAWSNLKSVLNELEKLCKLGDCSGIRQLLTDIPIGYTPQGPIEDSIWKNQVSLKSGLGRDSQLADVIALDKKMKSLD